MSAAPLRVSITGAAGQIGYSLVFGVARGDMFGPQQPVFVSMLDITPCVPALEAVGMELDDCAYPLLAGYECTDKPEVSFRDADVVLMVGAMPRRDGMERKDLLKANASIFKTQGKVLNEVAKPSVKVLVVGNPANTNCYLAMSAAPSIPRENFSALTRLDLNRAKHQVAARASAPVSSVKNIIIWGNHSSTQYPDVTSATIVDFPSAGTTTAVGAAINDEAYLHDEFVKTIQTRGAAVIKARKASSAASAAKAICDHVHDWVVGTPVGEYVSMGVISNGEYGVPKDIIYSYPVTCKDGRWTIVPGLPVSEFSRKMMDATAAELLEERDAALEA